MSLNILHVCQDTVERGARETLNKPLHISTALFSYHISTGLKVQDSTV